MNFFSGGLCWKAQARLELKPFNGLNLNGMALVAPATPKIFKNFLLSMI